MATTKSTNMFAIFDITEWIIVRNFFLDHTATIIDLLYQDVVALFRETVFSILRICCAFKKQNKN
jgi:hypothetical protein